MTTILIYTIQAWLQHGMGKFIRISCSTACCFLLLPSLFAQTIQDTADALPQPAGPESRHLIIGDIYISGNKVTKPYIIERELPFKRGDSTNISELVQSFIHAKERLVNTRLFNEVVISLKGFRGYYADIRIEVKERWYIFPLPYVRPVDRNFTTWAEKNYSLSRLDYGLRYAHYNFTGRNDNLRVWLITGYTKQLEMAYDQPYADKSLKHGFGFGVSYLSQKEVNVSTVSNQQLFINSDSISYAGRFLKEQFNFSLRYYWRPGLATRHYVRFSFNSIKIDSAVTVYGPHYFNNNLTRLSFPELWYSLTYNKIDYVPYPLQGFFTESGFIKRGISSSMNLWELYSRAYEAFPLGRKFYFVSQNMGMIKLPFDQPFYNQPLLGYGDFYMRGFEKYVVDGAVGGLARNSLLRQVYHFNIPFLRGTSHDLIPFRIFVKTYFDMGYVYNANFRNNSLVNQFLYSGGAGFDVVTFYDFVFRFEYSINQLGEKGFNFHIRNDF